MDRIIYYFDLFISLCGDVTSASLFGIIVVVLATITLIYAFYRAVYVSIWPGEVEPDHIKRRILSEGNANED